MIKRKKLPPKDEDIEAPVRAPLVGSELDTFKAWVEEFTGGPNKCQVPRGGVCIRPDIVTGQGCCNSCEYNQFCLCRSRVLK